MIAARTWTVRISFTEEEGRTTTNAVLHLGHAEELHGSGDAQRGRRTVLSPEAGDGLAAAAALSELASKLVMAAASDIDAVGRRVYTRS